MCTQQTSIAVIFYATSRGASRGAGEGEILDVRIYPIEGVGVYLDYVDTGGGIDGAGVGGDVYTVLYMKRQIVGLQMIVLDVQVGIISFG